MAHLHRAFIKEKIKINHTTNIFFFFFFSLRKNPKKTVK